MENAQANKDFAALSYLHNQLDEVLHREEIFWHLQAVAYFWRQEYQLFS